MADSKKLAGLIGLAKRAGRAWGGLAATEAAVKRGEAYVLLMSSDAGASAARTAAYWSDSNKIPLIQTDMSAVQLGGAIGRGNCAVVAVGEKNIATEIIRVHNAQYTNHNEDDGVR